MANVANGEAGRQLREVIKDKTVVIVDPSANYRNSLRQFLQNYHYRNVKLATSIADVRQLMHTTEIGMFVVEWNLGRESGLEFFKELQKMPKYRFLPFLMISGDNLKHDVMLASELGVRHYLIKPFSFEDFTEKILAMMHDALNPNPLQRVIDEGIFLTLQGDLDQAVEKLNEALSLDPESARAHCAMARVHIQRDQLDQGIPLLIKACELNPEFVEAHRLLLRVYQEKENKRGVREQASILHTISPDNIRYTMLLAELHLEDEAYDQAELFFQKTTQLQSRHRDAHWNLAELAMRRENYAKAAKHYRRALTEDKYSVRIYNALGMCYIRMEEFEKGTTCYRQAIELEPEDPRLHFNLGFAQERRGRIGDAIIQYKQCLKLDAKFRKAAKAIERCEKRVTRD